MKGLVFGLFLLFLGPGECSFQEKCDIKGAKNTYLWSVKHPKASCKGFLFGTIHVPYTQVWDQVSDRVREAFSYSDTVMLEIDLHDEDTVRQLIRCKNLRRKQTVASYLHPSLYQRIKDLMSRFRHGLLTLVQSQGMHRSHLYKKVKETYENLVGNWDRKRPEWLLFTLYQLCENHIDRPTAPTLDVFLANKAYDEEKRIEPIETTQEQCNPIKSLTKEEILFAINYTTAYLEHLQITERLFVINTERSISALVKGYRCGNLDENYFHLYELRTVGFDTGAEERALAHKIDRQLRDDIIAKRNERMANRINTFYMSNPHLTIFSAFGSGHFFGNDSVLHHLQRLGYIVENIREHDVIIPPLKLSNTSKFNSLWLRDHPALQSVSVEVIEGSSSSNLLYYMIVISLIRIC
ncbi:unnamed protein product [Cylicocyclus nassatus]|uniref:Metalloprotease TIKI homolog n=1 Tax=Cylicocyclus nassatus TaxID=53992 RepID=A0AA36MEP6_CYLNA|nr:unnamed protein product [Cylicocyclus nassatus]